MSFSYYITISIFHINRSMLISFAALFDNASFKAKLNALRFPEKSFLEWILTAAAPRTKLLIEKM